MKKRRRAPANDDAASPAELDDCARADAAAHRYVDSLGEMLAEAEASAHVHVLVDSLAYMLARIACQCGSGATGHIMYTFGDYMQKIEAHRRAGQEAEQAKQEGRLPH